METSAADLIVEDGVVRGVRTESKDGPGEIRAELVVAADGRSSTVRAAAELPVHTIGAPMDVLWMRLSRRPDDPEQSAGTRRLRQDDRDDRPPRHYWQLRLR